MGRPKKSPLMDDPNVKELFAILKDNGRDASALTAIINSVSAMERQLTAAAKGLESVQRELSTMREERNHPVKTLLEKTARSLSAKIKGLRARLAAIKDAIVDSCKRAVGAFHDTGISALNNLAGFFNIKEALLSERDGLSNAIKESQASVAKIETAAEQYHSAGRALKNIGRSLRGKEPIPDIKPNGKLARLIETPYRAEISCLNLSLRLVNKSIAAFDRLEKAAAKAAEAERPSTRETMKRLQNQIDADRHETPAKTKVKTKEEQVA
jgi:hypothetical protein